MPWMYAALGVSVILNVMAIGFLIKCERDLKKGDRVEEKVKAIFFTDPDRMFTVTQIADAAKITELEARLAIRTLLEQHLIGVSRTGPGKRSYYVDRDFPNRAFY